MHGGIGLEHEEVVAAAARRHALAPLAAVAGGVELQRPERYEIVGCRMTAKVKLIDTDTGKVVAAFTEHVVDVSMVEGSANICKWIIALDQLGIRKANR